LTNPSPKINSITPTARDTLPIAPLIPVTQRICEICGLAAFKIAPTPAHAKSLNNTSLDREVIQQIGGCFFEKGFIESSEPGNAHLKIAFEYAVGEPFTDLKSKKVPIYAIVQGAPRMVTQKRTRSNGSIQEKKLRSRIHRKGECLDTKPISFLMPNIKSISC
jgi:hypothetical protein